ncbi:MAG: response regulator [Ignavibacteriales bacterium]|nr:response regulator [Ignavibacteriales bacterium]
MKPRILVAEDSEINQKLIAHLLRRFDVEFEIVGDGLQAMKRLEEEPFDFIFMDLFMPNMGGLEATKEIMRQYSPSQRPVIIALTGNAEESDRTECLQAGMKDFLTKPISPDDVSRIIKQWFRG